MNLFIKIKRGKTCFQKKIKFFDKKYFNRYIIDKKPSKKNFRNYTIQQLLSQSVPNRRRIRIMVFTLNKLHSIHPNIIKYIDNVDYNIISA